LVEPKQPKEAVIKAIRSKAKKYQKVFTSLIGKQVLEDLETEFNPDILLGKDDAETNYNVGRRDVIIYIQQMIRFK